MRTTSLLLSTLVWAITSTACGGFFEGDHGKGRSGDCDDSQGRGEEDDDDALRTDAGRRRSDAGVTPIEADAGSSTAAPDAGSGPVETDAGSTSIDGGTTPETDAGSSTTLDAGSSAAPDAGACAPGECACVRDDDCPAELVCDHAAEVCVLPPVRCVDLTVEASCVSAAACQPVYAGQDCRNPSGGECEAGDVDCTCATFSFAACVDRS